MVVITEKTSVISSSSSSEVISSGVESSVTDVESVKKTTTTTESVASLQLQPIINLDQGDPTMYEAYWKTLDQELKITISGSQSLSYFANPHNLCWFLLPHLDQHIKSLHTLVGNAVVDDRHVVVGNGSSQLIQAALYALSQPLDLPYPVNVVSPTPFYSCYPQIADFVRSGLFKWGGDASAYDKEEAYIELVTSPNNPDGEMRDAMVKRRENGMVVHDLAYYWPQYTSITAPADHDIMLFTVSKCTGHAGSRVGWALVKDAEVAKRMVKFMEISTIGVSKEAQHRAATVLEKIVAGYNGGEAKGFFEFGKSVMAERWRKLREALEGNEELLQLPEFPLQYCSFNKELNRARPAYAWLKCKEGIDLEKVLSQQKVRVRGGTSFGCGPEYVRVSMMGRDEDFASFIMKIPSILQLVAA